MYPLASIYLDYDVALVVPGQRDGPAQALAGEKFPPEVSMPKLLHKGIQVPLLAPPSSSVWEHFQEIHHW